MIKASADAIREASKVNGNPPVFGGGLEVEFSR
jgi:hypothetical protein